MRSHADGDDVATGTSRGARCADGEGTATAGSEASAGSAAAGTVSDVAAGVAPHAAPSAQRGQPGHSASESAAPVSADAQCPHPVANAIVRPTAGSRAHGRSAFASNERETSAARPRARRVRVAMRLDHAAAGCQTRGDR